MRWENAPLAAALVAVGLTLMTTRARDKLLAAERRGTERQRLAAGTDRRRKQVRAMSVVVGIGLIAGGLLAVFGNAPEG